MWQNHNAQPAPPFYTQVRNLDVSTSPLAPLNMTDPFDSRWSLRMTDPSAMLRVTGGNGLNGCAQGDNGCQFEPCGEITLSFRESGSEPRNLFVISNASDKS